jgi:hypothetical protein
VGLFLPYLKMHIHSKIEGYSAALFCKSSLYLSPEDVDLDAIARVEIHGTDYNYIGEPFCEYHIFNGAGKLIAMRRILNV